MKIYTIKEIAKMANVSSGTVDRVLHHRGKVSPEKEQKVKDILKKIDFKPNQFARSLKLNKRYQFVVLMPDDELDEYWKPCFMGIQEWENKFRENGISVKVLKYSPNQPDDFIKATKSSLDLKPDGVLLGALYSKESKEYLKTLSEKQIPFNLINTVVENSDYLTFVGQNLIQSGRTAAHLFDNILQEKKSILIVHMEEEYENAFHMQQKENGFRVYIREKDINIKIETINIKTGSSGIDMGQLKNALNNKVNGIFVTTSKAFLLPEQDVDFSVPVIGYDLLGKNIEYLKSGKITFLIYQNPKLQAYQGLSLLSDQVIRSTQNPKEKYLPIEIISLENVGSYNV